jgi:hypothetical protein
MTSPDRPLHGAVVTYLGSYWTFDGVYGYWHGRGSADQRSGAFGVAREGGSFADTLLAKWVAHLDKDLEWGAGNDRVDRQCVSHRVGQHVGVASTVDTQK